MPKPNLVLLPNLLADDPHLVDTLPACLKKVVGELKALIAESEKGGRKYLSLFSRSPRTVPIYLLNEHTQEDEIQTLLASMDEGLWGVVSDAGLCSIADPGARLVTLARKKGIPTQVYPGPSSIVLALMLSGFSAQSFSFHGYLPRKEGDLKKKLIELQKYAQVHKSTQIWIEAPYRSQKMLEFLKREIRSDFSLAVAASLCYSNERVLVMDLKKWRKSKVELKKEPTVFLLSK